MLEYSSSSSSSSSCDDDSYPSQTTHQQPSSFDVPSELPVTQGATKTSTVSPQNTQSVYEIKHKNIVMMQRLAKKRKAFLIQKLTKRIKMLKHKKGNDQQLQKNQRKVERMLQKINDLKDIDFSVVISGLIDRDFIVPDLLSGAEYESTKEWFMFELTQDKASFMTYVNSLIVKPDDDDETVDESDNFDRKRKRIDPPESEKYSRMFPSKKGWYSEKDDTVLNGILKPKKNRPGQRARQKEWEEKYGEQAKHLQKSKNSKDNSSTRPEKSSKKAKAEELTPQEIIKKLKEKDKFSVSQAEHPSWAAKKQQAALSSKIDVFAGTKTTFSDDDGD